MGGAWIPRWGSRARGTDDGHTFGSVDPGILTYLMRQSHLTGDQLDDLLNQHSGCWGSPASPGTCAKSRRGGRWTRTGHAGIRNRYSPSSRGNRCYGRGGVGRYTHWSSRQESESTRPRCGPRRARTLSTRRETRSEKECGRRPRPGHLRSGFSRFAYLLIRVL